MRKIIAIILLFALPASAARKPAKISAAPRGREILFMAKGEVQGVINLDNGHLLYTGPKKNLTTYLKLVEQFKKELVKDQFNPLLDP